MTNEQRDMLAKVTELNFLLEGQAKEEYSLALKDTLSLINEQQEEIEKYKTLYERVLSDLVKADKQIELMADFMYKTGMGRRALSCMFSQNDKCNENGCRYCIKQYFKGEVLSENN